MEKCINNFDLDKMFWETPKVWHERHLSGLSRKAYLDYKLVIETELLFSNATNKVECIILRCLTILRCSCSIEVKLYRLWDYTAWVKWTCTQTSFPQFCHLWNWDNNSISLKILSKLKRWLHVKLLEQCLLVIFVLITTTIISTTTSADTIFLMGTLKQNSNMELFFLLI